MNTFCTDSRFIDSSENWRVGGAQYGLYRQKWVLLQSRMQQISPWPHTKVSHDFPSSWYLEQSSLSLRTTQLVSSMVSAEAVGNNSRVVVVV